MPKLWGRLSSLNVRKVVWAAQELGVGLERIEAGGAFGVVDTPAYRAQNPNGLVPLLEDDGLVLWESNVIVRYLGARYPAGGFYPDALAARFDAERWMDWQQTTLNPAGRTAFVQWFRVAPEARDPRLIAASVAATEPLLRMLDAHLARSAFLAGERFTMADVPIGCEIHRWFGLPQDRPALPHLERWYAQVLARPATAGVLDQPLA
ncbi:MAG: glutathione S-transferase [Deltaproteobacteria bacterium]|nr:glutathione S-transferase [Deltaproteobacteria bacterium]